MLRHKSDEKVAKLLHGEGDPFWAVGLLWMYLWCLSVLFGLWDVEECSFCL